MSFLSILSQEVCLYFHRLMYILFFTIVSTHFSFETADLENIMMILRQDKKLSAKQSITIQSLYKIYAKNPKNLSVLEDNIVFLSIEKTNKAAQKIASTFKPEWQLYNRLDQNGYSLAIEEFSKNGAIHELFSLQKEDKLPYVKWSENKLELLYVKGVNPVRNIMSYSVTNSKALAIVDSSNDDYSPIYGPNGQTVLFLSDRDKTHSRDKRVGIYVVFLDDIKHIYKLSKLSLIQPNFNFKQARFYVTDKEIIYYNENGQQLISISKLSSVKKTGPNKSTLKSSVLNQVINKQLKISKSNTVDEIQSLVWKEHEIKVQKKGDQVTLKVQFPYEFKTNTLSEMTLDSFENLSGPIFTNNEKYLFFITRSKGRSQINYLKRGMKEPKILSDRRENCFSMFFASSSNSLFYVLKRANKHFAVEYSLNTMKVTSRISVQNILNLPGLSPFFNSNNQIMYYDAAGVANTFDGDDIEVTNKITLDSKVDIRTKKKHLFSLETESTPVPTVQSNKGAAKLNIDRELKYLVQKIRKITTIQDLNQLKYRYSIVHSRVSTLSKDQSFVNNPSKKIKLIRWIELLNGIKVLLNQASILMEEE